MAEIGAAKARGQRVVGEAITSGIAADEAKIWDPDFKARVPLNLFLLFSPFFGFLPRPFSVVWSPGLCGVRLILPQLAGEVRSGTPCWAVLCWRGADLGTETSACIQGTGAASVRWNMPSVGPELAAVLLGVCRTQGKTRNQAFAAALHATSRRRAHHAEGAAALHAWMVQSHNYCIAAGSTCW